MSTTASNPPRVAPARVPKGVTTPLEGDPKLLKVCDRAVWGLVNVRP